MFRTYVLAALIGCGSSESAPSPAPAPAAPAPPPAEVSVGPDGPADLTVPAFTVDPASADQGKAVFDAKGCGACHQFGSKLVGPDLSGIGERRSHQWIARMIRHPSVMVKKDPVAKQLFRETMVEMTDQGVADAELGPLISFLVSHHPPK
ncbi:MAG: cytochrome c [Myxococcota bacterium]